MDENLRLAMKGLKAYQMDNGDWVIQHVSREVLKDVSDSRRILEALKRIKIRASRYEAVGKRLVTKLLIKN